MEEMAVRVIAIPVVADEEKRCIKLETLVSWMKWPATFIARCAYGKSQSKPHFYTKLSAPLVGRGPYGSVQGEAVFEMRVGLSQSEHRLRLQISSSCDG
jgi:hypothetical protein